MTSFRESVADMLLHSTPEERKELLEGLKNDLKDMGRRVKDLPKEERPKAIAAIREVRKVLAQAEAEASWQTPSGIAIKTLTGLGIAAGALMAVEGLGSMTGQNWMRPSSLWRDNEKKRPIVQVKAIQFTPELGSKINNLIDEESDRLRSNRDGDDNVIDATDEFGRAKEA